jgi:PAS domain S-box-containing protein
MGEGGEVQKDVELARRVYFVSITPFPGEGYANVYVRDITERKRAEEALRDAQKLVEANLDAMTRLQKLGTLFVREGNMEAVFAEIVDAAIAISGADFGNIQLLDPKSSDLKVAAQRGFPKWWLDFWNSVCEGQGACGTALEREERVIVEDVEQSPIFVGTPALEIQLKAGVRAVQSTPLVSRTGKSLGMFSTHYKTPHRPDDRALRLLDLLARQTADIIERARAEEVLRESEERLNRAQEIAHLGSWELNLDNNRLTWSDEVYRIFGLQPQEFGATYEAFLDAVHPDDRAAVDAAYSGSLREGRDTYEIEHQVVRKSTGETRIVHERCQHIRDTSGRIVRSIGMVHDVTERKRMEEELRQSEEKSRLLIKYAPSMFYEIDFHRPAFISVNDTMCQFLGYSREELLAMNPFDLLDDEGKALFRERIRRKFAGEEISDSVEYKSKTKDGREVYGVLNMSFTYKDGKPEGAVVVAHDITERKRAEELLWQRTEELQRLSETLEQQVQERTEELEVANEELKNEIDECLRVETDLRKSQSDLRQLSLELLNAQEKERKLVAGEIHDSIGSSLSAIKFKVVTALTEVADKSPETAAALQSMIPIVQGAIDESRRIQTNLRPSMLDDLGILATVRWFCRQFESTYAKIRLRQSIKIEEHEVPESLKTVIFRVLQEGLNNVAKHSRANIVLLSLQKADRAVKLTVRDNGQGFDLPKAQTADGTTQGLGLKNMRERIELSGGSFEIESTKGKGTVLRAWWPI